MKYLNASIKNYLDDLASDLPAPGGGSASSAAAALGVSLLLMVANFTKGKRGYERVQRQLRESIRRLERYGRKLSRLIDDDVLAYRNLSAAMKLPKGSGARKRRMASALIRAARVPLGIAEVSGAAIVEAAFLLKKGNRNLATDVGCGALMLYAAFRSSRLNVEINLTYIKDTAFVREARRIMKRHDTRGRRIADSVTKNIERLLAS